ncbi:MAG TPA: hypothetical protein VKA84_07535 [Gemmatimonadaceae bacterium]|nr:hypothetical protein [Gemmatimonadaceae bacterium]
MPRYQFALSTSASTVRQAGFVHSDSWTGALSAITEQLPVQEGDTLEIGVQGFPPAHYLLSDHMWLPASLRAA